MVIPIKELNHVSLRDFDADVPAPIATNSSRLADSGADANESEGRLEQVIVTAQKRSEDVLEVPASVSVVSAERLAQLQVNSLVDLDSYVPGLSIEGQGAPGARTISLRGVTPLGIVGGPTVATYIDDLPFGAAGGGQNGGGRSSVYGADLQPYDVAQIEILKGPQGTLYGANTLGGLIKYRLLDPDLKRLDIVAGTGTEYIDGSGKPGWEVHGAVSLPIVIDTLAIRVSGFRRETAGYIDNVRLGLKDVNSTAESGGLGSVLWKPTEALTAKATVLAQDVNAGSFAAVNVDPNTKQTLFGPQKVDAYFQEPTWNQLRNYALTVNWDIGFATLTSATSYSTFITQGTADLSPFGIYCDPNAYPGNVGCPDYPHADALAKYIQTDRDYKFTQETRLASSQIQRIQWMVGGYYSKDRSNETEYFPAYTPAYQQLPSPQNDIADFGLRVLYSEAAAFGNVTFKLTDRWDITAGERYSKYRESDYQELNAGVLGGCAGIVADTICPVTVEPTGSNGVSVWMGNVRFHVSSDTLLYVRASTGYQPGFFYSPPANSGESGVVLPSKTTNYEGGLKGRFLDNRLELDVAGFYTGWKDLQVSEIDKLGFSFPGNAGSARSTGGELTSIYQLIKGLRLTTTLAYTNARLTEAIYSALNVYAGKKGDQIPEAPLLAGSVALDYEGPLTRDILWRSGMSYRYRDTVDNMFAGSGNGYPMRPQNIANLYTAIDVENLTVKLYATNVFNDRAYTGYLYSPNPALVRYVPIQPRTVGLGIEYRF
jgi:outer membrane receptor protein involved in Fe transport